MRPMLSEREGYAVFEVQDQGYMKASVEDLDQGYMKLISTS